MDAEDPRSVAVLLTDLVGSTRMWQHFAAVMPQTMGRHHEVVEACITRFGGWLPLDQGEGDARLGVFEGPEAMNAAVLAALDVHERLAAEPWPDGMSILVRTAIDQGTVREYRRNVFGVVVNRCARVRSLGHGGQVVVHVDQRPEDSALSWVDLGRHQLRDITDPVRLWQVERAGESRVFPPLASRPASVRLPPVPVDVVGRDELAQQVTGALRPGRLVTLTAPGGTGKTTLALAAAHAIAGQYPGGAVFVDLSAVRDAAEVGEAVALVLGVLDAAVPPWESVAAGGAATLVVLDNCEQVVGLASVLGPGIAAAGGVSWLATSRLPIGLPAERVIAVPPLRAPGIGSDAAALVASPAGALLLERAREARPGLVLDDATADDLAAIARLVDGLPLALELAAARLRVQSAGAVRAALTQSTSSLRDGTARRRADHVSLDAVLAWSIDRVDPTARPLLDALAAFEASAPAERLAAVADPRPEDVLLPLAHLLDSGLVHTVDEGGEPRFVLLGPVREQVRRGWTSARDAGCRTRHAEEHRRWARHGAQRLSNTTRSRDETWIRDSRLSRADFLAALDVWAATDRSAALAMACDLAVLWMENGDAPRGLELLERLSAGATEADEPYRSLATVLTVVIEPTRVETIDLAGLRDRCRSGGALAELEPQVVLHLADAAYARGEPALARRLGDEAVALAADWESRLSVDQPALSGVTRPGVTRRSAAFLVGQWRRWREPASFLAMIRDLIATETPEEPSAGMALVALAWHLADLDRTAEAAEALAAADDALTAADFGGRFGATAMLALRRGDLSAVIDNAHRYLEENRLLHGGSFEVLAMAGEALLLLGREAAAVDLLTPALAAPASTYRALATARLARAHLAVGDGDAGSALLDLVAWEVDLDEASPGTLTYLLCRALTSERAQRAAWLDRYDDLVRATGVRPWPRDRRDRADLRASGDQR